MRPGSRIIHLEGARGVQIGDYGIQHNYFAPITLQLFTAGFERLRDVCFDPRELERDLDLQHFTGREELIGEIDRFIAEQPHGYLLVRAEAGVGKSCLAAHLVGTRPWPFHFTQLEGGRVPERARKSLAAQLITRWHLQAEYAPDGILPPAASQPDWFDRMLSAASRRRDETEPETPIVLVVDGLDEAEADAESPTRLPLGLPPSLPDQVFVVATSRFGIEHLLYPVRRPAAWFEIAVSEPSNLADMKQFIEKITDPEAGDIQLCAALIASGVDVAGFRRTLAERCAGVWIYLRTVLDEIRDGMQDPGRAGQLPGDLAGYYAEQVERWRGRRDNPDARERWERIVLPLLGVLAAARAPLSLAELTSFAQAPGDSRAADFLDRDARAFLSVRSDPAGLARYALRHESMRDFLTGIVPDQRPGLATLSRLLQRQQHTAHRAIVSILTPPGEPGRRRWQEADGYAREHLAAHAAVSGVLDELVNDPGFLIFAASPGVLAQRSRVRGAAGQSALRALDLSLNDWEGRSHADRLDRLAVSAAQAGATDLLEACNAASGIPWPIRWAAWSGGACRELNGHEEPVTAVAVGHARDRDVIVSGSRDSLRIWDAVSGEPVLTLADDPGNVRGLAVGRIRGRDVIVSSSNELLRVWDAATGDPIVTLSDRCGPGGVALGRAGDRDVVVSGCDSKVQVWDAITGEMVLTLADRAPAFRPALPVAIGRIADRDVVIAGQGGNPAMVWDAVTGEPLHDLFTGHEVNSVAIGHAGNHHIAVTGSGEERSGGQINVWDLATGEAVAVIRVRRPVIAVMLGQIEGSDILIGFSENGVVQLWDTRTMLSRYDALPKLPNPIMGSSYLHDPDPDFELKSDDWKVNAAALGQVDSRDVMVSGGGYYSSEARDCNIRIWSAALNERSHGLTPDDSSLVGIAIGQAGNQNVIISVSNGAPDSTVRVWNAASGLPAHASRPPEAANAVMAMRSESTREYATYSDGPVRLWDFHTGRPARLHEFVGQIGGVAIRRIRDRDVIAAGVYRYVFLWDAVTGDQVARLSAPDTVRALTFGHFKGRDVIVGATKSAIFAWEAPSGEAVATWERWSGLTAVAAGRLGDRDVIAIRNGQEIWVCDETTERRLAGCTSDYTHQTLAIGLAGTRDIVAASSYRGVRVLDGITGQQVAELDTRAQTLAIGRAADRDVIVSASFSTVQVWDAVTGALTDTFHGHEGRVYAVAIGRTGEDDLIASCSENGRIFVRSFRAGTSG